jgi:putative lipoic acid-binding regulatory protein
MPVLPIRARALHTMSDEQESPLKFPCDFPIKAMGKSDCNLDTTVVEIVRRHAPDLSEGATHTRDSKQGNYIAVTVVVRATSRAQLDAIYQDLVDHDDVIMAI